MSKYFSGILDINYKLVQIKDESNLWPSFYLIQEWIRLPLIPDLLVPSMMSWASLISLAWTVKCNFPNIIVYSHRKKKKEKEETRRYQISHEED